MKRLLLIITLLFLFTSVRAAQPEVVINEIGWMGTKESSANEWIELYNNTNKEVNLKDWKLITEDGDINIDLKGTIRPKAFFILERTADDTLSEVEADQIYTGNLTNNGQYLKLKKKGGVVQEINDKAGWRAGNSENNKTMEKDKEGWHTSRYKGGTPGKENSEPQTKEEQMPARPLTSSMPQTSNFGFTLIVALIMSAFSAAVIFLIKRELRVENK